MIEIERLTDLMSDHSRKVRLLLRMPALAYVTVSGYEVSCYDDQPFASIDIGNHFIGQEELTKKNLQVAAHLMFKNWIHYIFDQNIGMGRGVRALTLPPPLLLVIYCSNYPLFVVMSIYFSFGKIIHAI